MPQISSRSDRPIPIYGHFHRLEFIDLRFLRYRNPMFSRFIFITLLSCLTFSLHAKVQYDLENPDIIAQVNGINIPIKNLELLEGSIKRSGQEINKEKLLSGIVENRLIAEAWEKDLETSNNKKLSDFDRMAQIDFSAKSKVTKQFIATIRHNYDIKIKESINKQLNSSLASAITSTFDPKDASFTNAIRLKSKLRNELTSNQVKHAKSLKLVEFSFSKNHKDIISLWDLYSNVNIQGRIAIQNGNLQYINQQVQHTMADKYFIYWAYSLSGIDSTILDNLKLILSDKLAKEQYLQKVGLRMDIHDDNSALKALAKTVTQAEVNEYYQKHKQDFKHIESVQAQHIRLSSQQQADKIYKQLTNGLNFDEAVKTFSIHEDRNHAKPGDLGLITLKTKHSSWLRGISFVQPENRVSRPFRSPRTEKGDPYWEIIRVYKKRIGYLSPDSESVRYQASQEIAKKKAVANFHTYRQKLINEASIALNPKLVDKRQMKLGKQPVQFHQSNHHHGH